jgi:hypothetical protein
MLRNKKAKIIIIGVIALLALSFGFVSYVQGHSPASMTLNYVAATETLEVTITHTVSNPSTHFVNLVEIRRDNVLNISEGYTSQPTSGTFSYNYIINATAGQTLEAQATCIQGGSITRSIVLTSDLSPSPTNNASLGYTCYVLSLAFFGFIFIKKRKRNYV